MPILRLCTVQSRDNTEALRNHYIAQFLFRTQVVAISRLRKCIVQSPDWLRNLNISMHFPDSENVQRHLEIETHFLDSENA